MRILALIALLTAGPLAAQAPHDEPLAVVQALFAGMHAKDSTAILATFAPGATLLGYEAADGAERLVPMASATFARQIAGLSSNTTIEERIWDAEVRVDDNLATVWAPYAFFLNGQLRHCGVDAVMLMRFSAGWKIVSVADTRRVDGCEAAAR